MRECVRKLYKSYIKVSPNHSKGVTITTSVHDNLLINGLHQWYLVVRNHSKDVIVTTWQLAWLVATMNDYSTSLPWTKTSFFSLTPRQWPDIAMYKFCVRKLYKLYLNILSKNLYYWVEIVIWHGMIKALMTKQLRIRISPLSFYLIKIKYKWLVLKSAYLSRFYIIILHLKYQ